MIQETLKGMRARDWVALFAISAIVAVCGVVGVSYVSGHGWPKIDALQMVLYSVVFTPVAAAVLFLTDAGLAKLSVKGAVVGSFVSRVSGRSQVVEEPDQIPQVLVRKPVLTYLVPELRPLHIAIFAAIMAVFWLPWLVANYPGGTYWDTYYQIFQIYPENHPIAVIPWAEIYDQTLTDAWLVDHHPVFTTLVYGAFGWVSDQLTGNWMAGVFAFVCLQGAAHVVAFSAAVAYMRERSCPLVLCLVAYIYFCIMPFVSTWALCMVKDSFFGLFIIPYFIILFEAVRTRGGSLARRRTVVWFTLCALGLCLTKKTGLFIVVPVAVIGAIVYREKLMAFIISGAVPALIMLVIFPFVLFPALNIQAGGTQETFGPLFQQTARVLVDYPTDVSPDEHAAIDAVLDYNKLRDQYAFDFEDSVKYRYNLDATSADLANYLRVYAQMGLRHPDSYFGAIASLAGFYVAPTAFANIRMVTVDTKMGPDQRYMLWNPKELENFRKNLDNAYKAVGETPVIDIPLLLVTWDFWLPAALIYVALRRRLRCGTVFVPALVLLAFCVIAPVYDARYVVPIFNMAPLLVCAISVYIRQKNTQEHSFTIRAVEGTGEQNE